MTTPSNKPLAVVTGASNGIGFELAKQFARNGFDLVVAAEDHAIHAAADDFERLGAQATPVQADLATFNGVHALYEKIQQLGRPVAAAAINAGVGVGGNFVGESETDLQAELNMIQLNCAGTVHLAKHLVRDMAAARSGKVLFTGSIAGTMPAPYEAVYGATKAFVNSFSEALREEMKDRGVTVTVLMPGETDTNFFHRAGMDDTKVAQGKSKNDPADVAKQGFDALMAGKDSVVGASSLMTKVQGVLNEILPETTKAAQHAAMSKPGSGEK